MDEILNKYLILFLYLIVATYFDITVLGIPMWASFFAFLGRMLFGDGRLESLALAGAVGLAVYFTGEILSRIKGFCVLGKGDIYIIFVMGLFLDFGTYMNAIFISCILALVMAFIFCAVMHFCEFPLAPAFLFGTIAAVW